jgi:hypothetical protein
MAEQPKRSFNVPPGLNLGDPVIAAFVAKTIELKLDLDDLIHPLMATWLKAQLRNKTVTSPSMITSAVCSTLSEAVAKTLVIVLGDEPKLGSHIDDIITGFATALPLEVSNALAQIRADRAQRSRKP